MFYNTAKADIVSSFYSQFSTELLIPAVFDYFLSRTSQIILVKIGGFA